MSISKRAAKRAEVVARRAAKEEGEVTVKGLVASTARLVGTLYNTGIDYKDKGIVVLGKAKVELQVQAELTTEYVQENKSTWKDTLAATIHKAADKVSK